jgi:hypothetical protein
MDRTSLNPLQELRLMAYLWRLYRREQPALVHHFTIKCVVYGSIAALLARVPARVNAVVGMGYVFTNQALKARLLRPRGAAADAPGAQWPGCAADFAKQRRHGRFCPSAAGPA